MHEPRTILVIDVEYSADEADALMYVATNDDIGLVTEGQSFEDLLHNLKEALDACLGGLDTVAEYNLVPHPQVELRMPFVYGETA
ncbi:DUF1902 domain-containing protein [bacterium]|nr:DUF1902 domain-containing protein [bacterium]